MRTAFAALVALTLAACSSSTPAPPDAPDPDAPRLWDFCTGCIPFCDTLSSYVVSCVPTDGVSDCTGCVPICNRPFDVWRDLTGTTLTCQWGGGVGIAEWECGTERISTVPPTGRDPGAATCYRSAL